VLKDNSARDSAELSTLNDRVKSLEADLKSSKGSGDQFRNMCQQLKNAVEQYKKRSEQLEADNKKHMEAVFRYG
jgi:cell division septum initiation protein DivIVA